MFERSDLKTRAKLALKRNYLGCVIAPVLLAAGTWLTSVILNLFTGPSVNYDYAAMPINAVSSSVTVTHVSPMYWVVWLALMFLVLQPLLVGVQNFFIKNARYKGALRDIMPKSNYAQVVIGTLVQSLLIVLFTCLLIVPGIVKAYEYRMVPYLLADHTEMSWRDALKKSKEMMQGNKMDTFILDLSFIGWGLLAACTCGILAVFWVTPYMYATGAELYLVLGGNYGRTSYTGSYNTSSAQDVTYRDVEPITPPQRVNSIYESPDSSIHPILPPDRRW